MSSPFHRDVEIKEIAEVNVVPLADVSLVLLILLLVLSPMMAQSMLRIQAAAESNAPAPPMPYRDPTPPPPPELVLVVGLQPGAITVGEQIFHDPGSFMQYMRGALEARTDKKVFLSPSGDVPNGQVVVMLETLKACGASSVSLVQTQEPEPQSTPQGVAAPGAPAALPQGTSGVAIPLEPIHGP